MDLAMEGQYSYKGAQEAALVAYKCLSPNPKKRPTMREVVKALEPILDMHDYLQVGTFVFTVAVEDTNKDDTENKLKLVDGEKKADIMIETTVEEKHQSHHDRHRKKYPNSAIYADIDNMLHRDGSIRSYTNSLGRQRRSLSYLRERGA
ncbi:hypothetical protein ABZP36_029075 [Zizania latifolia]